MNPYIYLGGAILAEVIGTTLMKFSEGFTRLWPSVGTIICYCASFWLLAQTLAYIPTGIAYAIWSGVGIVLISLLTGIFWPTTGLASHHRHDVDLCRCVSH